MTQDIIKGLMMIGLVIAAYFFPLIVAMHRNHRQTLAIGVLNFFAGWTIIAWVIALIWACTNERQT